MKKIAQELAARRRAAEGDGPPWEGSASPQGPGGREGLTALEKEAVLLLWRTGDHELMWDIGVVRIMLRRVLGYVTDSEGLSVAERVDLVEFLIMGAGAVVDLVGDAHSLRPRRKV